MNLEISPAAAWTLLRILTLPSGAVSSSWMWKRLYVGLDGHREILRQSRRLYRPLTCLYFTFSLLLT